MAYATINAAIAAAMNTVTNAGHVYTYVRWYPDVPALLNLFRVTTPAPAHIRFWDITRVKTPEENKVSKENLRRHTFRIRGFMSLDDSTATEITFQELLETMCAVFRNKPTLGEVAEDVSPLQIDNVGHATVGGILCHMAECSITISEAITWQES